MQVRTWQETQRNLAKREGFVRTMLGRQRRLPGAQDETNKKRMGHALRAAINTPVQVTPPRQRDIACLQCHHLRSGSIRGCIMCFEGKIRLSHRDHQSAAVSWHSQCLHAGCLPRRLDAKLSGYPDWCLLPYLFTIHVLMSTSCAIRIEPLLSAVQPFAVHIYVRTSAHAKALSGAKQSLDVPVLIPWAFLSRAARLM